MIDSVITSNFRNFFNVEHITLTSWQAKQTQLPVKELLEVGCICCCFK